MIRKPARFIAREKRHLRIRKHISGTPAMPRLAVFRSNKHIYAQIIDDSIGGTIVAASTVEKAIASALENTSNVDAAKAVGEAVAKKAVEKGITRVVFDRGGYVYHGKIQALADAAREGGLQF